MHDSAIRFVACALAVCELGCAQLLDIDEGEESSGSGGGDPSGATGAAVSGGPGAGGASASAGTSSTSTSGTAATGASTGAGGSAPGMIGVAEGIFQMGCNTEVDDECDPDEAPYHEAWISAFQIDATEVTRGAYSECIAAGACAMPACDYDPVDLADHPVTCVNWNDASAYCAWAGKRLPTEAEWEKAARSDGGYKYPWKTEFDDNCDLVNANLCELDTTSVGSFPEGASPYGVLDMSGNAAEWVADFYDAAYYLVSPPENPHGPAVGGVRVHRGGSWNSPTEDFRCSSRSAGLPTSKSDEIGFRCAL